MIKRNIFIDLGCFDGDTIAEFKNWSKLAYPKAEWEIHGFDPNPDLEKDWRREEGVTFEASAAWLYDGTIALTVRPPDRPYGSTVMPEKVDWGQGKIVTVPCFDFAKYLEQFKNDFVIVKMDIEGAELPVLTHLIEQGADQFIGKLMVEWHDAKMPAYPSNRQWILDNLSCEVIEWF